MKARPRVLVVDDDESIRQFIEMALAHDGFDVALAEDGKSALAAAGRFKPDVILLDMRMPGVDGWPSRTPIWPSPSISPSCCVC